VNTIDTLKAARKVSTPIICITTPDLPATVASIVQELPAAPILQHDIIRGILGLNEAGKEARARLVGSNDGPELPGVVPFTSPAEALSKAAELPARALLFIHNANRLMDDAATVQAICNLRDLFKSNGRTLVLLATQITLSPELTQDTLTIDEPLPNEGQIRDIIARELKNAREMKTPPQEPDQATIDRSVEALAGLAAFPCEQAIAMTLAQGAIDVEQLWTRKRGFIANTRGLVVDTSRATFDEIGGLENAKAFGRALFAGRKRPRAIVRIDEIEKMLAGAAGDTSGTSQDALGTILREMEDQDWAGLIAVGPPGSGKSIYSKTLGATHDAPTFSLDMGAAKGSLVGQSEERIRQAMKVIKAVAADGAFFVATCNKLEALPPELRRRFRYGLWFFDLPSRDERETIWNINARAFGINLARDTWPEGLDAGWTGAEIRNVCELAWRMSVSVVEAARFIVPVSTSDPGSIEKLRALADQKFLSASYPGVYKHTTTRTAAAAAPDVSQGATRRAYEG
jgi:hypothetical protein